MKSRDEREYKILFLLDRDKKIVAIDRSCAEKLKPILRKHRYGEVPYTADLFGDVPGRAVPVMYVYPIWERSGKWADGWVLLWAEAFEEAGYTVRVKPDLKTKRKSYKCCVESMKGRPSIACILDNDEIEYLCHEQDAKVERVSGCAGKRHIREKTTEVLNIRVRKKTAELFRLLCEERGLTQDRALSALLDLEKEISKDKESKTSYEELHDLIFSLEAELDTANVELMLYKKKYHNLKNNGYIRRKDQEHELKVRLVREFLKYCTIPQHDHMVKVHRYNHKQAKRFGNWHNEYIYPSEDGISLIRLEHACYGRGKDAPLFIFGRTEDGYPLKFRFYYKRSGFLGKNIGYTNDSKITSRWLCAYLVSKEGAADLIGALPLGSSWIYEDERKKMVYLQDVVAENKNDAAILDPSVKGDAQQTGEAKMQKKISLDEQLKDAKSRVKK